LPLEPLVIVKHSNFIACVFSVIPTFTLFASLTQLWHSLSRGSFMTAFSKDAAQKKGRGICPRRE
jgi:hypothetical protein